MAFESTFLNWSRRIDGMLEQGWRLADLEVSGSDLVMGWRGRLEHHGVPVAMVIDDGRGGFQMGFDGDSERARFLNAAERASLSNELDDDCLVEAVCKFADAYWVYDRQLNLVDQNRVTAFRLRSDDVAYGVYPPVFRKFGQPYTEAVVTGLKAQYGTDLCEVVNETVVKVLRAEERYFEAYGLLGGQTTMPQSPKRSRGMSL